MKYVFVDFEMQPIPHSYQKERIQCTREVIEIGAVMLDEELNEIISYKEYIKPIYSKTISKRISDLTGITYGKVQGARTFLPVLLEFHEWCEKNADEYVTYAWSENDFDQILKEMFLKGYEDENELYDMLEHWVDLQKEYVTLIDEERMISLEAALDSIGIEFQGAKHDALYDARNTAELYRNMSDPDRFLADVAYIRSYPEKMEDFSQESCCLGDLFDFNKLMESCA